MKRDGTIDLTLTHEGGRWVARNDDMDVSAPTLSGLDLAVKDDLIGAGRLVAGETVRVFMAFDNATIPQWIRQYAQHYFNRVIELSA